MLADARGDRLLAAALALAGQVELWVLPSFDDGLRDDRVAVLPLVLLSTVAVGWRRSHPLGAASAVAASVAVQGALVVPTVALTQVAALLISVYSVSAYSRWGRGVLGLALAVLAVLVLALGTGGKAGEIATIPLFAGAPWVAGRAVRAVRGQALRLAGLNRELQLERDRSARLAAAAERTRLARELHDVVSHGVGVMTVQAAGAARIATRDPDRAVEALHAIEGTGREALDELQRMVTLLRSDDEVVRSASQPTLDQLNELVERTRAAGVVVELRSEGDPSQLPAGVGLAAYRVVQESLTNAVKHASGAHVGVDVRCRAHEIVVEVVDRGGTPSVAAASGGHGLAGMRERVAMYGGLFDARPLPEGGFRVQVRLPVTSTTT